MSDSERNTGLSSKQLRAIECLLTKPSLGEAAEAVGVSEATLRRWRKEGAFSKAFTEARAALLDAALTRLQAASGKAVETLESVMDGALTMPPARVSAARAVLELGLRVKEATETSDRLKQIEELLAAASAAGVLK